MTDREFEGALVAKGSPDLLVVLDVPPFNTSGWMQLAEDCAALTSKERPTVLVPVSLKARREVAQFFSDRISAVQNFGLPNDGCLIRVVLDREVRDADVLIRPEAPMFETAKGRSSIQSYAGFLSYSGLTCSVEWPDDSGLYTTIQYATGETVREQVLGWDDVYGDDYAAALERIELEFLVQKDVLSDRRKRGALAKVAMQSRPTYLEYVWLDDGKDCILEADCGHAREQALLAKLKSLALDEFEALKKDVTDAVEKFAVDERGRFSIPTEQYASYKRLVARAKRHKAVLADLG